RGSMNNPNDIGPTVTVARADAGHNNGQQPSLGDRVRSLRLSGAGPGGGRARGSALAWVLCAVLLFTTTLFGYRAYRLSPADSAAPVETDSTKDSAGGGPSVTPSLAGSGAVALEQKGYVVPAHQIQVSPKITGIIVWLAGDGLPGGALGVTAFPAFKLEKKF